MADTEHEVKVVVTADVRNFQQSMKQAADMSEDLKKQSKRFKQHSIKGHKQLSGISKDLQKGQKKAIKEAIQHEKKLEKAISSTVKQMKDKMRASNNSANAIKGEVSALKKLEDQLVKVRKERHRLGGKTMGEKLRGAGQAAGGAARGAGRWLGGAALGLGAMGIGGIIGLLMGQVSQSYSAYTAYGHAQGGLIGLGGRRDIRAGRGARFGYDMATTAAMARGVGRQTGNIGDVGTAQELSRAYGFDVGEAGGYMGTIRQAGKTGFGKGGRANQELAKIMAIGVESGIERSRLAENIGGVMSLIERQRSVSAGEVSGVGFAKFLAALGRSGLAGFQGAAGANVAQRIDAAIRAPGGGEAGQALLLQSFGFGKPGGGGSYMDALRMQERGLSDPENFVKVMREVTSQVGAGDERQLTLKNLFGVSLDQAAELGKIYDQGKMGPEALEKLSQLTDQTKSIEEQALDQMKQGFGSTVRHLASLQNDLVDKGGKIAGDVRKMQNDINDLVRVGWPAVQKSIELIATGVRAIHDAILKLPGMGQNPAESWQSAREALYGSKTYKSMTSARKAVAEGALAREELRLPEAEGVFGSVMEYTNKARIQRANMNEQRELFNKLTTVHFENYSKRLQYSPIAAKLREDEDSQSIMTEVQRALGIVRSAVLGGASQEALTEDLTRNLGANRDAIERIVDALIKNTEITQSMVDAVQVGNTAAAQRHNADVATRPVSVQPATAAAPPPRNPGR